MKPDILPQLQVFLAVARLRGFSAAARELGVSTAAVSHSVRQLEEQLRVVLLTRTTRSVALTDAGRRLVETAGPGLGQAIDALKNVSAAPGEVVGRQVQEEPGYRRCVGLEDEPQAVAPQVVGDLRLEHVEEADARHGEDSHELGVVRDHRPLDGDAPCLLAWSSSHPEVLLG